MSCCTIVMLLHCICSVLLPDSQTVVGSMQEEIQKAPLPIIHYGLDLWTCKVSGRKYLDFHVFYVDNNFVQQHALIAVSDTESL